MSEATAVAEPVSDPVAPAPQLTGRERSLANLALSPQFTKETAAEAGRRAAAVRWGKREEREVQGLAMVPVAIPAVPVTEVDGYCKKRIRRVREQIEALNERLDAQIESGDAKDLKALTDAIGRLAELERILSGRPLPGQRRPGRESLPKRAASVNPLE